MLDNNVGAIFTCLGLQHLLLCQCWAESKCLIVDPLANSLLAFSRALCWGSQSAVVLLAGEVTSALKCTIWLRGTILTYIKFHKNLPVPQNHWTVAVSQSTYLAFHYNVRLNSCLFTYCLETQIYNYMGEFLNPVQMQPLLEQNVYCTVCVTAAWSNPQPRSIYDFMIYFLIWLLLLSSKATIIHQ